MLTRPVSDQSTWSRRGGSSGERSAPGYPYGEIASARSVPSISRTITGSRSSAPPSIATVWVTASASRKDGERKNCSGWEAAAPPSSIRVAFTRSLVGRLWLVLGKAAPDLDVDQMVAVPNVPAQHTLLPPAVVDDGLLGRLVPGGDPPVDLVGAELLVGLPVGEPFGLSADPPAAHPVVAHDRAELGRRLAVQAVERREAHRIVDALHLDRPLAVLGARVPRLLDRAVDPATRIVLGELALAVLEQVGGGAGRVEPAVHRLGVVGAEVPQRDPACHQLFPASSRSAA